MSLFDDAIYVEGPGPSSASALDRLVGMMGGETHAGPRVNEHNALKMPMVLACVRVLSETIASLPFPVYRRLEPRGKERDRSHPLFRLLNYQANPDMSSFTFWETLVGHLALWGNAYAEIEMDRDGQPLALWPLAPHLTRAERLGGEKVIRTTVPERNKEGLHWRRVHLPARRVLHIPGLGYDGLRGYSVIGLARQAVGWGMALEEFSARFFKNGTHLGWVATHPTTMSDPAYKRLKTELADYRSGLEEAHRLLLLEEGVSLDKIGMPSKDAQYIETHTTVEEIVARIFRVQPHKVGLMKDATFSNIEHQAIEFVTDTVRPLCCRVEAAVNTTIFDFDSEHYAEFLIDSILRGDAPSRAAAYSTFLQNGVMNRNEVRERENLNAIPGRAGEVYTVQLAMADLEALVAQGRVDPESSPAGEPDPAAGEPDPAAGEPAGDRSGSPWLELQRRVRLAMRPAFRRTAERFMVLEARRVRALAKKAFESGEPAAVLEERVEAFYETFPETIEREYGPTLRSFAALLGEVPAFACEEILASVIRSHVAASKEAIRERLAGGAPAFEEMLAEWESSRAVVFAETETGRAELAIQLCLDESNSEGGDHG